MGERTQDAKRRAIARGVPTFAKIPPGYRRTLDEQGKTTGLEPDPATATAVAEAFRLRAGGATVKDVRAHLREHGIERSFHGVQALLGSRIYLGEIHFGALANTGSHPAIVDADTWAAVQRARSPRGRRAKSERLLARLGVLRCATCGARMVVGSSNHGAYALYRCPPVGDCPQRVTISAETAERTIVAAVRHLLAETQGAATIGDHVDEAERALQIAEQALTAAVEAFTGLDDVAAAQAKLGRSGRIGTASAAGSPTSRTRPGRRSP